MKKTYLLRRKKVSGFDSKNFKVGDEVIIVSQLLFESKSEPFRALGKITRITPAGKVRVEASHPYPENVDWKHKLFYPNGDLVGDYGRSFWLELAPSSPANIPENLVEDLKSHPNWYKLSESELLEINAILMRYK